MGGLTCSAKGKAASSGYSKAKRKLDEAAGFPSVDTA